VEQARAKGDWATVIKFAPTARLYTHDKSNAVNKLDWVPGNGGYHSSFSDAIDGYPIKSAYAPHLEALLRLDDVDGANGLYDEMLRRTNENARNSAAKMATDVAKSVGMQDIATIWEKGEPISPALKPPGNAFNFGGPYFVVFADMNGEFVKQFSSVARKLSPRLVPQLARWNKGEDEWWGLFAGDNRELAKGYTVPDLETMRGILKRNDIIAAEDHFRTILADKGRLPGIELMLAERIMYRNFWGLEDNYGAEGDKDGLDEIAWGEAARLFRRLLDSPDTLFNAPSINPSIGAVKNSQLMKSLSGPYLAIIESLIEAKPSNVRLWDYWLKWRNIDGGQRPMAPLVERLKPSPLSEETVPNSIMDEYYNECKKNNNWPRVIELLKAVWDREFARMNEPKDQQSESQDRITTMMMNQNVRDFDDRVGAPLIEAYLRDNKPTEADKIFNAWLDSGRKFKDIAKLVELAKELGQERLAKEWEAKAAKK